MVFTSFRDSWSERISDIGARGCVSAPRTRGADATPLAGAFTLVELLVVVAVVSAVAGLLLATVQRAREAANRAQCLSNLKQIGLALHGYHDSYGSFHHAYDCRALFSDPSQVWDGKQWIVTQNWATLILPFSEQGNLERQGYAAYQGWNLPSYHCPSDSRSTGVWTSAKFGTDRLTDYLAVTGTDTFQPYPSGRSWRDRNDGVLYGSSHVRMAYPRRHLEYPTGGGAASLAAPVHGLVALECARRLAGGAEYLRLLRDGGEKRPPFAIVHPLAAGEGLPWAIGLLTDCFYRLGICYEHQGNLGAAAKHIMAYLILRTANNADSIYALEEVIAHLRRLPAPANESPARRFEVTKSEVQQCLLSARPLLYLR